MLTIEHPLTGEKLQVANKDFSQLMNWEDAVRACRELGSGWRLPSIEELDAMFRQLHLKSTGDFMREYYWSSTESDSAEALLKNFQTGFKSNPCDKAYKSYVRAVRAI